MALIHNLVLKFGIAVLLFASGVTLTYSAVSSVDLGSEWLKVAVVNLKPGKVPISIAINEMSKRKSPALVAFHEDSRLLGEEAAGIVARYPEKVYSQLRDILGKPTEYVKRYLDSMYLPFNVVEDSRGAASFKLENGVVYSAEELLAMLLGYGLDLAEFHSKVPMKDAVVNVPAYFGQAERRGIIQAAQLAGMHVISLVNEHCGAALQYGIDKNFSNGSRNVVFYDMGSKNTYASLVHFSSYNAKEFGKIVSINQFQVKDVSWDSELGGNNMESRLVDYFADEFNKQLGSGFDVRTLPKAMAKLKKQVKRTKEILSANTAAPISVESLYDDRDFRSSITREKFEQLCDDLWEKALNPLKEVIASSGLKMDDIFAVELIGGATRVPKLQAKIQEFLGRNELDKHLDADEAIVLGSSLLAANLTDGIKLNRKLGMIDGSPYGFNVEFVGPDLPKDESTKQLLAPRMKKLPSKMFRSFPHNKDFEVFLSYESERALPPGTPSPIFAQYAVTGLASTSDKYSSRNLSAPVKASLHFSLSRSGILSLDRADAVIEVSEWVDVPKKNVTVGNVTITAGNSSSVNATLNTNNENEAAENLDANEEDANTTTSSNNATPEIVTEKVLKKKTFRIPLTIIEKTAGPGQPFSKEYVTEAKKKLEELKKKDAERKRTAELKNNLEEYIYSTKEKIEASEEFQIVSTSDERQSFMQKLEEVQDWLYTDGEDATASQFDEKLQSLKAIGDPIFFRFKELTARPAAIDFSRQLINDFYKIIENWEEKKPWLPESSIDQVRNETEFFKTWLNEKEALQKKTPGSSIPIITSEEIYEKVLKLQDKVSSVNKIPKPKPPKAKKNETESSSDSKQKDKSETSDPDPAQNIKGVEDHDEL